MVTWGVTDAGVGPKDAADRVGASSPTDPAAFLEQLHCHRKTTGEKIPHPTEECYVGKANLLVLPSGNTTVKPLDFDGQYQLTTPTELPDGTYLITVTSEAADKNDPLLTETRQISVRIDGPATVTPTGSGTEIRLDTCRSVTVGFRNRSDDRPSRIQIPETVAGFATGLSYLSAAHHTIGPSRSHPGFRDHPPLLTTGESTSIPSTVERSRPETGIEFRLPASIEELFVAAPLAYYLGATVTVEQRDTALLTTEDRAVRREFGRLPQFQESVAAILRKVFYLDCLVRRTNSKDGTLLAELSLDAKALRSLSPEGRLERYLDVPSKPIENELPDWHLSTYAQPSLERGRSLPFLLDKLSLIYLADGSEMDRRDLLDRTLTDTYSTRGDSSTQSGVLDPNLQAGRTHAWMAPGTPIDAFKTMPKAFENRYRHRGKDGDCLQVSVVRNDTEMEEEHSIVAEIYSAADLPMDVTVSERLTSAELAGVFETENDFVHFIGHCDEEGLRCPDGHLAMSSLTESKTRTFFLNACGSYDEGLALIEQGAVAGAVTFTDVLDNHAALVGTAFARLLSRGYSIQRALELARNRIMMGKDYAVVGDGTYALVPNLTEPAVLLIEDGTNGYDVACEVVTPQFAGESYRLPFSETDVLNGNRRQLSVDAEELRTLLEERSLPVIYEGKFRWSEDLAVRLGHQTST